MARTSSVSEIQLITWRAVAEPGQHPEPGGQHQPGQHAAAGPRTSPVRRQATRMPAARAGSAAASQSCTTRGRKPVPAGASSVTG